MSNDDQTDIAVDIEPGHFRSVLGRYPTGVCVVTGCNLDGNAFGLVVGSFTSVSLNPPLVAFVPHRSSSSWSKIRNCGRFCVNVLAEDQVELCNSFARSGSNKFDGIAHRLSPGGMPVLDDVVAYIECQIESELDGGDHTIVIGRVSQLELERDTGPLIFCRGKYGEFAMQD